MRTFKRILHSLALISIAMFLPGFAYAQTGSSWTIGEGGDSLTSLTVASSGCELVQGPPCAGTTLLAGGLTFSNDPGAGNGPNSQYTLYLPSSESNMSEITDYSISFVDSSQPTPGMALIFIDSRDDSQCTIVNEIHTLPFTVSGSDVCDGKHVDEVLISVGTGDDQTTTITVSVSGTVTDESSQGGGNYIMAGPYKPVSSLDIMSISESHGSVQTRPNANIHSVTDAQVINIISNGSNGHNGTTIIVHPAGTTGGDAQMYYFGLQNANTQIGANITAGCVLGLAGSTTDTANNPGGGELGFLAPEPTQTDWPDYDDSPTDTPCNAAQQTTASCINLNPNFADNASSWYTRTYTGAADATIINGSIVELPAGTSIYQDVTLDPEQTYVVTASIAVMADLPTDVDIGFGDAQATVHVYSQGMGSFDTVSTETLSPGTADTAPDTYRLELYNPHLSAPYITPTVRVNFLCIATSAPPMAPGSCYFAHPDLDTNDDDWQAEGGSVTYVSPSGGNGVSGSYTIPGGAAIYHNVQISAWQDNEANFTLVLKSKAGAGAPLTPPYGRWHVYIRDHDTSELIEDLGTWDLPPLVAMPHVFPFTLESGESVNGDLVIANTSDEISSPGWDQSIYQICLQVEGGTWPGHNNPAPGPIFNADCTLCTEPGGITEISDVGLLGWIVEWLQFGWCFLGFILRCYILTAVNNTLSSIGNFMIGVALFGKWVGLVVTAFGTWVASLVNFLWHNFMAGIITLANSIIAWLLQQPFIQDVIDDGSLALIWINALIDLVVAIFGLFGLGIQMLGAILSMILTAFASLIYALVTPSTIVIPFPDCHNSASFGYDGCLIMDVFNFMITQAPMFGVLIHTVVFALTWMVVQRGWKAAGNMLSSS